MHYKKSFRETLKPAVIPLMASHGFENKGQMLRRYAGDVVQSLVFQAWNGNTPDSYWFTANIGLRKHTPRNTSEAGRKDWYDDDVASHLLTLRSGSVSHGRDYWYKTETMDPEELASILCADLQDALIPFFDFYTDSKLAPSLKGMSAVALRALVQALPRPA
jgi:hypothetical protein